VVLLPVASTTTTIQRPSAPALELCVPQLQPQLTERALVLMEAHVVSRRSEMATAARQHVAGASTSIRRT
jgi:hypothetical protein